MVGGRGRSPVQLWAERKPGRWAAPAPPWYSARADCCGCAAVRLLRCGLPCAAHPCPGRHVPLCDDPSCATNFLMPVIYSVLDWPVCLCGLQPVGGGSWVSAAPACMHAREFVPPASAPWCAGVEKQRLPHGWRLRACRAAAPEPVCHSLAPPAWLQRVGVLLVGVENLSLVTLLVGVCRSLL